jgi:hypothetical protein
MGNAYRGKPKKHTKFQPNWITVVVSVAAVVLALWLFWSGIHAPVVGAPKVLLVILVVIVAILVCFTAGMRLILELYSKGVWATPEEQTMAFPGDDLVKDPDGKPVMRVRQARDLDAPLDGGKRCRMYSFYDVAHGPHNPFTYAVQKLIIGDGGAMMGRRAMLNIKLAARFQRRKSIPLRIQEAMLAPCRGDDDWLHKMLAYPDLRWSRDCPRIETIRAPFTDDPNWPPAPGEQYVPPIAENTAKAGWTPDKAAENNRIEDKKQHADLVKYGFEPEEG